MATNKSTWVGNLYGVSEPLTMLGLFQAGSTAAVKKGEILELTAVTNTRWVPMDSDFAGAANVAIAAEELKAGDRAGYYKIMIPRPGDIFVFALSSATDLAIGTALYWSDSQTVKTSGSNVLCYSAGQDNYPPKQGHLADDASPDAGTTIKSTSYAKVIFKEAVSYWKAINVA